MLAVPESPHLQHDVALAHTGTSLARHASQGSDGTEFGAPAPLV